MFYTNYVQVSNKEFIETIFGDDSRWCHVTDFTYDPGDIPKNKHLIAWKGDYYCRYQFEQNSNQYFTISTFYCDDEQQARRRKALYKQTPCIVLDDVKEKLSMNEVRKLPQPAWVLETSNGSEQWGYILDTPCTNRAIVENLLDGLVANGLAPDGRDPGMKGVTRYVRLPDGVNSKSSKLVNGQPFKCRMSTWEPTRRVTIQELALPFCVDLDAVRREARVDGAASVSDHPLINIPEIVHIKEIRSDGRFDITCPWVNDHTGQDDSGSAVFTNADGSIGFKCHHGNCQERTGKDLLRFIEGQSTGFSSKLKNWQVMRELSNIATPSFLSSTPSAQQQQQPEPSFLNMVEPEPSFLNTVEPEVKREIVELDALQLYCDELRRQLPGTTEQRNMASDVLQMVDDLPKIEQRHWHDVIVDVMRWSKADFKDILVDLRRAWYGDRVSKSEFYDKVVYVKELNQFYDNESQIFFSTEAFQNSYSHEDAEARKIALQDGRVKKVDKLDYAPKQPKIFTEDGTVYGNTWAESSQSKGEPGDVSRWLGHFDKLGWTEHRDHIEKWMAYTLKYPERKINHMLLLGSGEGCGKDYLLYPLIRAMGQNSTTIEGEELKGQFNDYLLATKYLHVNEAELGDHNDAKAISNKLKPLAAAPPERLRANPKGVRPIKVRNIVNATMTTNSVMPLRLNGPSRRFFAIWSDMNPRDRDCNMQTEWLEYWKDRWDWMKSDGWKAVVHYFLNDVDLSNFNPDQAPPMTDFLRDIQEASKSPMQLTLETFIAKQHGSFRCDMLTTSDMGETLRSGLMTPGDMVCDPKYFTDKKIGMLLREIGGFTQIRLPDYRLWIIRNEEKYDGMSDAEIRQEYERQMCDARGEQQLTIVR